jgi:hypothetical protein
MIRVLFLFSLVASACSASAPCAGHDGTCIALTVDGAGSVDHLRIQILDTGGTYHDADTVTASAPRKLPLELALLLNADLNGTDTLIVTGSLGTATVGAGSAHIYIAYKEHFIATVTLTNDIDAAVPADMSGGPTQDAAPPAKTDMARTPCPAAANLDCETFEGTPDLAPFSGCMATGTTIGTKTGNAELSGAFLEVSAQAEGGGPPNNCGLSRSVAEISTGQVWARFYVYSGDPQLADLQTMELFVFSNNYGAGLLSSANTIIWQLFGDGLATGNPPVFVPNVWHCVELENDYTGNVVSLYVDPTSSATMPTASRAGGTPSGLASYYLGVINSQAAAYDVRFDDFAVGTQRIGCY